MIVILGNRNAIESVDNGATFTPMPKAKRATRIEIPDDFKVSQAFVSITAPGGVWATQAQEDAIPAWVASESPGLASLLAEHFGGIEIRDLEEEN